MEPDRGPSRYLLYKAHFEAHVTLAAGRQWNGSRRVPHRLQYSRPPVPTPTPSSPSCALNSCTVYELRSMLVRQLSPSAHEWRSTCVKDARERLLVAIPACLVPYVIKRPAVGLAKLGVLEHLLLTPGVETSTLASKREHYQTWLALTSGKPSGHRSYRKILVGCII